MNAWYVIKTKANAEKKVHERMLKMGMDAFLPCYTTLRQWSDRKKKVTVPFIPNHVFVRSSVKELSQVYGIPGVAYILNEFGKPAIVRDIEIENLRLLSSDLKQVQVHLAVKIEKGNEVLVQDGPFKGLIGMATHDSTGSKVHLVFKQIGLTVVLSSNQVKLED